MHILFILMQQGNQVRTKKKTSSGPKGKRMEKTAKDHEVGRGGSTHDSERNGSKRRAECRGAFAWVTGWNWQMKGAWTVATTTRWRGKGRFEPLQWTVADRDGRGRGPRELQHAAVTSLLCTRC